MEIAKEKRLVPNSFEFSRAQILRIDLILYIFTDNVLGKVILTLPKSMLKSNGFNKAISEAEAVC